MKTWKIPLAIFPMLFVSACGMLSAKPLPVAVQDQPPIKNAAKNFVAALASGDERAIKSVTTVDPNPSAQRLAAVVRKDAVIARRLQEQLARRFDTAEPASAQVGSDAWLDTFNDLTDHAAMLQIDQRARIGDETTDGVMFLRQIDGAWKVELIPTLVAESGGRVNVPDPAVEYSFGVAVALNQMLLDRMERDEFSSYREYQHARNAFWAQYLALIANGEEPHDKLLPTLPYLPKDPPVIAESR